MSVSLRPATADDAADCASIYTPYVTDSWISFELVAPTREEMAGRITEFGSSHAWLMAEADGCAVGYAYGSPHRTRAAYDSSCDVAVYVDPAHARRGIGRALYQGLLPALANKGCHAAFAGITLPNAASVGLHEAMGFTPVGIYRQVGWKLGGWRDVQWWQRLL